MDIFTIAWVANRLPWLVYVPAFLGILALGFSVLAYAWRVVYSIIGNVIALRSDWHKAEVDRETYRQLKDLAVTDTQKRLTARIWADTDVEIEALK